MVLLVLVGFLGGIVTAISPCVLPVLPVVFASGAASGLPTTPSAGPGRRLERRRRPVAVVAGLVVSFGAATLFGSWLLGALGLPQDLLRWVGVAGLGLVGVGLLVPGVGELVERPFVRIGRGRPVTGGGGLVLGMSLGLVFVPCAGPVLAAISVVGATHRIGWSAVVLTAAFCAGIAVPLLAVCLVGQRLTEQVASWRARAAAVRRAAGALLVVAAVLIGADVTSGLQRLVPGYTNTLQSAIEGGSSAGRALAGVTGRSTAGALGSCDPQSPVLQDCGPAPAIRGIAHWLNTPGDRPLSLARLRGRVVLVDFWTYSCINCQRTLPHVEAWARAYGGSGLTVIGVHTPEFAFEHVLGNVRTAAAQLGVRYPIALDNQAATWDAYENAYWPAEYLVDARGVIRHVQFGEGDYGRTETLIRSLLAAAGPSVVLPPRTDVPDATPSEPTTPESYLGDDHPTDLAGQALRPGAAAAYQPPAVLPADEYAYGGEWTVGREESTAGPGATIELNFSAKDVYLVLGGQGTVDVRTGGRLVRRLTVVGVPRLYQLVGPGPYQQAVLDLAVSPGVAAYDFTFG